MTTDNKDGYRPRTHHRYNSDLRSPNTVQRDWTVKKSLWGPLLAALLVGLIMNVP